jgi:hypothetical protein
MPHPHHLLCLGYPNNAGRLAQIKQLVSNKFSPSHSHFLFLGPKCVHSPFSNRFSMCYFGHVIYQVCLYSQTLKPL